MGHPEHSAGAAFPRYSLLVLLGVGPHDNTEVSDGRDKNQGGESKCQSQGPEQESKG